MKLKSILICKQSQIKNEKPIEDVRIALDEKTGALLIMDAEGQHILDEYSNCKIIGIGGEIMSGICEEEVELKKNGCPIYEMRYLYMRPME